MSDNKVIDLSDCKVGDKLWSVVAGTVEVLESKIGTTYPILITEKEEKSAYDLTGKFVKYDIHPTLFHSFEEFCEYWDLEKKKTIDESLYGIF